MTVPNARRSIVLASLVLSLSTLIAVFVVAAADGPLTFEQAMQLSQISFPVFLGYLGAATQFLFHRGPSRPVRVADRQLFSLLVWGPLAAYSLVVVVALAAFLYSNRAEADPGSGMTIDILSGVMTAALSFLTISTNGIVGYLFAVEEAQP